MTAITMFLAQIFTPKSAKADRNAIDWDSPLTRLITPSAAQGTSQAA